MTPDQQDALTGIPIQLTAAAERLGTTSGVALRLHHSGALGNLTRQEQPGASITFDAADIEPLRAKIAELTTDTGRARRNSSGARLDLIETQIGNLDYNLNDDRDGLRPEVGRLTALIHGIPDSDEYAQDGQLGLRQKVAALATLVENQAEHIRRLADLAGLDITAPFERRVIADATEAARLELENELLDNAKEYTTQPREGGPSPVLSQPVGTAGIPEASTNLDTPADEEIPTAAFDEPEDDAQGEADGQPSSPDDLPTLTIREVNIDRIDVDGELQPTPGTTLAWPQPDATTITFTVKAAAIDPKMAPGDPWVRILVDNDAEDLGLAPGMILTVID